MYVVGLIDVGVVTAVAIRGDFSATALSGDWEDVDDVAETISGANPWRGTS